MSLFEQTEHDCSMCKGVRYIGDEYPCSECCESKFDCFSKVGVKKYE